MKIRESGMPEPDTWESFFDARAVLVALGMTHDCGDVVEFGCGYGTFTLAAAERTGGTVHALDLDDEALAVAKARAAATPLLNVRFVKRDFVAHGTGLGDGTAGFAMVFNILHHEEPVALLREAYRNLHVGGILGIIHWNHDPETPRGPPMAIRPRPEQCRDWAREAGFECDDIIELPPHHYGMAAVRR